MKVETPILYKQIMYRHKGLSILCPSFVRLFFKKVPTYISFVISDKPMKDSVCISLKFTAFNDTLRLSTNINTKYLIPTIMYNLENFLFEKFKFKKGINKLWIHMYEHEGV